MWAFGRAHCYVCSYMFLDKIATKRIKPAGQSCETSALHSYTKYLSLSLPVLHHPVQLALFFSNATSPGMGHLLRTLRPGDPPSLGRSRVDQSQPTTVTTVTSTATSWGCPGLAGNCQNRPGKLGGCWTDMTYK